MAGAALTTEIYEGLGNAILNLALSMMLLLAWAASRRRTEGEPPGDATR